MYNLKPLKRINTNTWLSIAQNRPDNFPSYPPDNHHCSDEVYLWEGGDWVAEISNPDIILSTLCCHIQYFAWQWNKCIQINVLQYGCSHVFNSGVYRVSNTSFQETFWPKLSTLCVFFRSTKLNEEACGNRPHPMPITQSIGSYLTLTEITNLNINWSWLTKRYFVLIHSEIQEL